MPIWWLLCCVTHTLKWTHDGAYLVVAVLYSYFDYVHVIKCFSCILLDVLTLYLYGFVQEMWLSLYHLLIFLFFELLWNNYFWHGRELLSNTRVTMDGNGCTSIKISTRVGMEFQQFSDKKIIKASYICVPVSKNGYTWNIILVIIKKLWTWDVEQQSYTYITYVHCQKV